MMGRQERDQASLFYEFRLDDMIPRGHLLRGIDVFVTAVLTDLHDQLKPFYSDIGRPSIDPELLIRMHLVGYCFGIRSERKLCEEVKLHLAYRWFCKLDLDDIVIGRAATYRAPLLTDGVERWACEHSPTIKSLVQARLNDQSRLDGEGGGSWGSGNQ